MCCDKEEVDLYQDTIDSSRELSLQKAIAIFHQERDRLEKQKPPIKRPDMNPLKGFMKIMTVVLLTVILWFLSMRFQISPIYVLVFDLLIAIFFAKKTIVWLVLVYQKYAPERVRRSCVFEPTCSNYMLLAIEKYGLVKGVLKGIRRLFRCHPPNGGVDNP